MADFCNIQTLVDGEELEKYVEIDNKLFSLMYFTTKSNYYRNFCNRLPFAKNMTGVTTKKDCYIFKYLGKEYPFTLFSEWNLQDIEKETIKDSQNKFKMSTLRNLRLACSLDIVNPKLIIGNSSFRALDTLISYEDKGTQKIIDYSKNLVMKADDYFKLFKFDKLNMLEKWKLYNIYMIVSQTECWEHLFEFLLFYDEIFSDLAKNEMFDEYNMKKTFNVKGFHKKNNSVLGNKSDSLFFDVEIDQAKFKYKDSRKEIDNFTLNPSIFTEHVRYDEKKKKYIYEDKDFGMFEFGLLSDLFESEEIKADLLSENRYHKCHSNSYKIIERLSIVDQELAYLVAGKIRANDTNDFYHSWVEIDSKNVVLDYNRNIVMNRDKYYKLYGVVALQRTMLQEMEEICDELISKAELILTDKDINYFGSEILFDLKKNEKVFSKK